jgi:hypothetical protein
VFCVLQLKIYSQDYHSIFVTDKNSEPVAFAIGVFKDTIVFSNRSGELKFKSRLQQGEIYAIGFKPKSMNTFRKQIILDQKSTETPDADTILYAVWKNEFKNNPNKKLVNYNFDRYNKTLISRDSIEHKSTNENLFSERISHITIINNETKEYVEAQKNQGFEEPILRMLSNRMHDLNWYEETYTIFENDFVSPLHKSNFSGYNYDLIHVDERFYYIKFSPDKKIKDRLLEGVLTIDKNFALAGIYVNKDDEIKLDLYQTYFFSTQEKFNVVKAFINVN